QIKTAHFEAVLQGVMPKEIFDQVESQIIRQPFLRRDMRTLFALKWRDRDKHILTKKTTSIYSISNISRAEATFNLTASIDLEIDTQYHDETRFQEIRVQRGNSHDSVYTEEQIRQEGIEVRSDRSVSLKIPVRLQPREEIKVSLKYDSIVSNRYAILVTTIPTIGFELAIDHEPDMAVKVDILYPFADSFRELISDDTYKSWRIDDGMLPMQGFELTWHRTSIATDGE
ncbi:MAG: hypothetical protein KIT31_30880, partial [Deltaproteobacteria bacterium]|nr:hypothetical protein [Deltaproteobacteria bacterium]